MYLALLLFVGIQIVALIWIGVLTYFGIRAYQIYKRLTADIDKKDVASILENMQKKSKLLDADNQMLSKQIEQIQTEMQPHMQKIGFVRYNPFGNTGGDQSFCLCLLDGRGNGILLTSLHARQQTRIYTKEILNNQTKDGSELSKEEKKCLQIAQKWSSL